MKNKQSLKTHFRVHKGRFRCELCSIVYAEVESLHNHTELKHPDPFSSFRVLRQAAKKAAMGAGASKASEAPNFKQAGHNIGVDSVVKEVNDIAEGNPITEDIPITEVSDLKVEFKDGSEVNDISELNDVKEAADDVKKKVNGVMELNDANTVVGGAVLVLTRKSQLKKHHFCLDCFECFRSEEDLEKHEREKHPQGDPPESNEDDGRSSEPFVHTLRWSSEENLLALSSDSEPMNSAEGQTTQTLQQGRKRKASSTGLDEIPAERVAGKRRVKKKVAKSNADSGASDETDTPTPVLCRIRMSATARSPARSRHCKTALQNSTDTPGRQTDTTAGQTDTPAKQTDNLAKRTGTLTDNQGRQTNTLQQVNGGEVSKEYPVGAEASREERHADPERQEKGSTSEEPERVNAPDGNMLRSLKPCSIRLVCLPQHTLEAYCIKGLKGTAF